MQLRADVAALQLAVQRARSETDAATAQADRRGREHAAEADRQLGALTRRLESLSSTLASLTGRVDELNTRVEGLNRQLRTSALPPPGVSPSIVPAPGAAPSPGATPTLGSTTTPAATPTPGAAPTPGVATAPSPGAAPTGGATPAPPMSAGTRPTTGALQPQDIYQAAYLDFSKGSYPLAIAGFREFLRRFPDHELAGNAQYWVGEAHYSLARGYANAAQTDKATQALEQAVTEFRRVVVNYPRGEKVPAALFKEALTLIDLKQPGLAQARLQYLIDNFPQAEETPLARDRLAALKSS